MGFQQGLSGLNAASKYLDSIGNNVSNSNTVGFKASSTQFADVFASSLTGAGGLQVGIGTKIGNIAQQFTQGNITSTNNPLDVAINGKGFFRMDDNGTVVYSRAGQFQLDKDGYIVNGNGLKLTGYNADATGSITAGTPINMRVSSTDLMPTPTTTAGVKVNLDSGQIIPDTTPFNYANPDTYNSSTSLTVYDSLGNDSTYTMYFVKTAANSWNTYATVSSPSAVTVANPSGITDLSSGGALAPLPTPLGTLKFTTSGAIDTATTTLPFTQAITSATALKTGAADMSFKVDFTGSTQFGSAFGVNELTQNGNASGRLTGFSIGADGVIKGRYTNGKSLSLGQVVLANFTNPQGLQPLGNNAWAETSTSGAPLVGAPSSGSLGVLQSSAVEDSNVDLTAELVNMITAQRTYQANAQTIKTQDQVLQTLVNLR